MRPVVKVYLYREEEKVFGEGPYRLLLGIERHASLRAAAKEMGMAYTKALFILKRAEEALGFPLTEKKVGGAGGGGSVLTAQAKEFLEKYERYRARCAECCGALYLEIFS